MKRVIAAFAAVSVLPLFAGLSLAADRLSDGEMDRITAGAIGDPGCPPSCGSSVNNPPGTKGFVIPVNTGPVNLNQLLRAYTAFLAAQGYNPPP